MSDTLKTKKDNKGILHSQDLETHRIYTIFTKAGERRGGKAYSEEKAFVLLSGRVQVTLELDGEDESLEIMPGELIHIESGIPHVFYFPEDTEMVERFAKDSQNIKSDRLYEMKKGSAPTINTEEFFDDQE